MGDDDKAVFWEVVGGEDKGGILVRMDVETDSSKLESRLATGSIVKQWDLQGERLQYELVSGSGPEIGWVSIKLKGKELVVKLDKNAIRRKPLGDVLPPIKRSPRCPGPLCVPKSSKHVYEKFGMGKKREPRLYVLMFPGAEDRVVNGWMKMECQAPDFVEMATYEWPGHGERSKEPFPQTLEELADDAFETFKDAMKVGHFIVVGHSIGALLMTYVCERAKRELRVSPSLAFALDRGAPHLPVLTEMGLDSCVNKPEEFMSIWGSGHVPGSDAWKTRVNDQKLDNHTRPIGFYRYPCRVHIVAAGWTFAEVWPPPGADPNWVAAFESFSRVHSVDPTANGPFTIEEYKLWSEWATDCNYVQSRAHHMELKSSSEWLDLLWKDAGAILAESMKARAEAMFR